MYYYYHYYYYYDSDGDDDDDNDYYYYYYVKFSGQECYICIQQTEDGFPHNVSLAAGLFSSRYVETHPQSAEYRCNTLVPSNSKSYFTQQSRSPHPRLLNATWIFWIDMFEQFWQQRKQHLQMKLLFHSDKCM